MNNLCDQCGIERKLMMSKCNILKDCDEVIPLMEWNYADRKGKNARGKQNKQLELSSVNLPVRDVVSRLIESMTTTRVHMAKYEWHNLMRKIDLLNSDPSVTMVFCTDFAATLDLGASEKDNCSVNNHAVVCIIMASYNWRKVKYIKKTKGEPDIECEVMVCDTDRWVFFGESMSKGKKNDHVFHMACLDYIISFYAKKREEDGLPEVKYNIVWTDQCPNQYKCRQNFYNV